MTTVVRTEKRQRSFIGKVFKYVFIAFNLLMAIWVISGLANVSEQYGSAASDAARAGTAIGATMAITWLAFIWIAGVVILGAFVLLTRGKKVVTEEKVDG